MLIIQTFLLIHDQYPATNSSSIIFVSHYMRRIMVLFHLVMIFQIPSGNLIVAVGNHHLSKRYPLVICKIAIENDHVEILSFPMNSMVIFHSNVNVDQRVIPIIGICLDHDSSAGINSKST